MAEIFISYARPDRDWIERLAAALEAQGHTVWWDRHIAGGAEYSKDIEAAINDAKVAIVAWSATSVESTWVKDEAATAREMGKLIPITIDGTPSPMGFKQFHLIDFDGWHGKPDETAFQDLERTVRARLTGEAPPPPSETKKDFGKQAARTVGNIPTSVLITLIVAISIVTIVIFGSLSNDNSERPPRLAAQPEGAEQSAVNDMRPSRETGEASIAVLPFADLSPEGDQTYFSDGISEEILNVLARIDGLDVASRTSAFQYKDRDIGMPEIARELNVRYVLEGSLRKSGNTLRITAQLIEAANDRHLWSETYDRPLTAENIFAIQDEIAAAIVDALNKVMGVGENGLHEVAVAKATDNVDAYELYLKARTLFQSRTRMDEADALLARAVTIDPQFAKAWEIRAAIHSLMPEYGYVALGDAENDRRTVEFAEKALSIDPQSSLAIATLANKRARESRVLHARHDYGEIIDDLKRALEIDPKNNSARNWLGMSYGMVGAIEEALEQFELCVEDEPYYAPCSENVYDTLVALGRMDEALAAYERALRTGSTTDEWINFELLAHFERKDHFMYATNQSYFLPYWRRHDEIYEAWRHPEEDHSALIADIRKYLEENPPKGRSEITILLNPIGFFDLPPFSLTQWSRASKRYRQSPEFRDYMKKTGAFDYWKAHGFPPQCRPRGSDDFECD